MLKGLLIFLIIAFLVGGGIGLVWCQVQQPDSFIENIILNLTNDNLINEIPLYDINGLLTGYLKSTQINGKTAELIYYKNSLIAFGQGEFLSTSYDFSKERMKNTLNQRYGNKAQLLDQRLIMIHPLKFVIQGRYLYQGKVIDDLIFQCQSSIFTLKDFSQPQYERVMKNHSMKGPSDYWRVSYQLPIYLFYLSDFSTCLLMLADYWRSMGWIKTQLHPDDERYFLVNLHLMMQDVEMLRRKCQCDDNPKNMAEIIRSFIKARGLDVQVNVWEADALKSSEINSFHQIKKLIQNINQPCLMELSSKNEYATYAVLTGYAQILQGEFLECVFPTPYLGELTYQRYFFRWQEEYDNLKIYQILNPSGSGDE